MSDFRLSGWCSPDCCQARIEKGQLAGCGCEARGGHENPVVEGDSRSASGKIRDESGPESAETDRGLATVSTTAKGA